MSTMPRMHPTMRDLRALLPAMHRINDRRYASGLSGRSRARFEVIRRTRPVWRPVQTARKIATAIRTDGRHLRSEAGVSLIRQFREQYSLARRFEFAPEDYYKMLLYERYDNAGQYVSKKLWGFLIEFLMAARGAEQGRVLDDKLLSHRHFTAHNLPTTALVAVFDGGRRVVIDDAAPGPLPAVDLFSKPVDGERGLGAERWMSDGRGGYTTLSGERVDEAGLIERLEIQSRRRAVLLQERAYNHPDVRDLVGMTLTNVRLFTLRPPEGPAEVLSAFLTVPVGDIVASNHEHEDLLLCPMNEETGRVSPGVRYRIREVRGRVAVHPLTGRSIDGFMVPYWPEARKLAVRAHDTFDQLAMIGWDIGFTEGGPIIIEGNRTPGGTATQMSRSIPWGRTRFPEVYLAHLRLAYPELFEN